jgi:hypothetical protein
MSFFYIFEIKIPLILDIGVRCKWVVSFTTGLNYTGETELEITAHKYAWPQNLSE